MIFLRKAASIAALMIAPFILYQFFFLLARKPLNDDLVEAVKKNDLITVKSLMARGADINSRDSTRFRSCTQANPPRTLRTPLMLSMFPRSRDPLANRDTTMRDLLLEQGADPNIGDVNNDTALHFAASRGDLTGVKALLDHGAQVNVQDESGDTPLIKAAYMDNKEVVKLLLDHDADVNLKGELGFSALARTTGYRDNIEIMKMLISHGADVNTRNDFGGTPLHGAAEYGRTDAIQLLIQHGADPNTVDHKGQKPFAEGVNYGTKTLDKRQDTNGEKIRQRKMLMKKLLTSSTITH